MLPTTSSAVASAATPSAPKSVFERAAARLGLSGKTPQAAAPGGAVILETFRALKGGARTAFFRANKEALLAAEAVAPAPAVAASPVKAPAPRPLQAAPAARLPQASAPLAPDALLGKFQALTGAAKTAFFRENRTLLKAAAAVVAVREAAQAAAVSATGREARAARGFAGQAAALEASAKASPAALLETFQALNGAERTAFFRANHSALKFAAAGN